MRSLGLAMLLIAGCGDQRVGPDADPADAEAPRPVSVWYRVDATEPAVRCGVYFQNADSSLVLSTRLDRSGRANAFMADGGFVTLSCPAADGSTSVWTWAGVRGGDELELDLRSEFPITIKRFRVTVPPDPQASTYQLQMHCGSSTITGAHLQPIYVDVPDCDDVLDLLILTRAGGSIIHSIYRADVEVPDDVLVPFDPPYVQPLSSRFIVTNLPAGPISVTTKAGIVGARDFVYSQRLNASPLGQRIDLTYGLPTAPKFGQRVDITDPPDALQDRHMATWVTKFQEHIYDFAAIAPPAYTERPSFDAPTRTLHWGAAAEGVPPDAVIAGLWFDTSKGQHRWTLLAPLKGSNSVTFPVLPSASALSTLGPVGFIETLTTITVLGGYDAIREHALGRPPSRDWPMLGPEGRVVFQTLRP